MRQMFCLITLLSMTSLSAAGDEIELERLKLARMAVEARLKTGDLLRDRGDIEGALREYREAALILNAALGRRPIRRARPTPPRVIRKPVASPPVLLPRPMPAKQVAAAVTQGLVWLSKHQDESGRWDCDEFAKHDPQFDKCDGLGATLYDVGVSGLSVLAFLKAGHTDLDNPFSTNVRRGLNFLIESQDEEGCFGARSSQHFIYNSVLACWAMVEAFRLTKNPAYGKCAQRGVDFILKSRNPYLAWRYEPRGGENDTSVTAWCVQVLKAADAAGLKGDPDAYEGARMWIDKMTDAEFGQVGYSMPGGSSARMEGMQDKFPPQKTQAMTAAGILTRIACGENPRTNAAIQKGSNLCMERPPVWNPNDGSIDMYYWYFGTRAMAAVGGESWQRWKLYIQDAAVRHQHQKGSGAREWSWDPIGAWGTEGGRVYATAIMTLTLQASR